VLWYGLYVGGQCSQFDGCCVEASSSCWPEKSAGPQVNTQSDIHAAPKHPRESLTYSQPLSWSFGPPLWSL
jgi:hypothetical protein